MAIALLDARARVPAGDLALVKQLLAGNESAFTAVVHRYHGPLLRFARLFVSNQGVAEEVVQDTWLAVLRGLPSFEGRSALKSWMFSILANRAKSRAVREKRIIAFSELSASGSENEPAVDPDRFTSSGAWPTPPGRWNAYTPESLLLDREALGVVELAMAALPAAQRVVVTLRDVEGVDAADVCRILEISETNQRVLLHRARSKVRASLERYMTQGAVAQMREDHAASRGNGVVHARKFQGNLARQMMGRVAAGAKPARRRRDVTETASG